MVVLAEMKDLADHLRLARVGANQRTIRPFSKAFRSELLVVAQPAIERVPGYAEIAASHRDVARDVLDVLDDRETPSCSPG